MSKSTRCQARVDEYWQGCGFLSPVQNDKRCKAGEVQTAPGPSHQLGQKKENAMTSRSKKMVGYTIEMPCPCGHIYVTVNFKENGGVGEILSKLGKSGGCASAIVNGLARVASYALREGMDVKYLEKAVIGISCHRNPAWDNGEMVTSCLDAIGRAVREAKSLHEEYHVQTHEVGQAANLLASSAA